MMFFLFILGLIQNPLMNLPFSDAAVAVPALPIVNSRAATAPASSAPAAAPVRNDSPVDALLNEDVIRSLRDPFALPSVLLTKKDAPKTDLEIYPLKDFKLNGVITGPKKTRAMVTTPSNKVFFVRVGDRIGVREGHVSQISPDSIRVLEYYTDEHGKRMPDVYEMKMSGEVVSLSKQEE